MSEKIEWSVCQDPDSFEPEVWTSPVDTEPAVCWHVCWAGEVEGIGFLQHRGPAVTHAEAWRRLRLGRQDWPWIIYWIERD